MFFCVVSAFSRYWLLRTKYALLRDLTIGTFEDFFNARWLFFSSSKQGVILNTFIREMTVVGDSFGAMGLFFASSIQLVFYLMVPFYLSWQVASLSMATALLFASPFLMLGRLNYRALKKSSNVPIPLLGRQSTHQRDADPKRPK